MQQVKATAETTSLHPRMDKTWRNTAYDLTKIPSEASHVFYRARLEVTPKKGDVEPVGTVLELLRNWLASKEEWRGRNGSVSLREYLPACDELASSSFAKGAFSQSCCDSFLRTEAVASSENELPAYWAMEYVERDRAHGYRFWITEIGISFLEDSTTECVVVNARVRYYDDATYIYKTDAPQRNSPRFVRDIILSSELEVTCGGVPLKTYAVILTQDNFDLFVEQLIDEGRTTPIVVVSRRDANGESYDYPVNPLQLARLLTGVAVVYALDRGDEDLERSYGYVFGNPAKPAYKYRLEPGCLRIYWGGVDLDEPTEYDYARHRFFTSEALEAFGVDSVFQHLSAGMSRMFTLKQGEVLGIRSVRYQASLARVEKLQEKRKIIEARLRETEEERIALEQEMESFGSSDSIDVYRRQADEYGELLEIAFSEIDEYKQRLAQSDSQVTTDEYEQLLQECAQSQRQAEDAQERAGELQRENGQLKYRVGQLEDEVLQAEALAQRDHGMEELLLSIGSGCKGVREAMNIAEVVFADRMVFLDDAVESAYDFKGQASELFKGLAAMYEQLWPMRFGPNGVMNINEGDFKSRTGFGVSFHEGKQTNRDVRLMRLRQHEYQGKVCDFIPHVKGGDKKRGHLRIHFIFDPERELIVVGHCGEHLETYGTHHQ